MTKWWFKFSLASLAVALAGSVAAGVDPLVSEAEMRLYNPLIAPMASQGAQSAVGGPDILWVRPDTTQTVQSPLEIQILVIPSDTAPVDWSSLRVFYGALRFDITDRILARAQRDDNQLIIPAVKVPNGAHRLLIQVSDTQHRQVQRELVIRVGGSRP